MCALSVL